MFRPSRACFVNSKGTAGITWRWACVHEVPAWPGATLCSSHPRAPPKRPGPPRCAPAGSWGQPGRRGHGTAAAAAAAPARSGDEHAAPAALPAPSPVPARGSGTARSVRTARTARRRQRGECSESGQSAGRGPRGPSEEAGASGTGPRGPTLEEAGAQRDGDAEGPWREEAVAPERPCCRPAGAGTRSRAEPGLRSRVSGDVRVGPAVWLSRGRLQQGVRGPRQGPARRGHGGPTLHSAERLALGSSFGKSKGDRFCTDTGQARHLGVLPEKERGSVRGGIRKLKTPKGAPAGRGPVWVKVE